MLGVGRVLCRVSYVHRAPMFLCVVLGLAALVVVGERMWRNEARRAQAKQSKVRTTWIVGAEVLFRFLLYSQH